MTSAVKFAGDPSGLAVRGVGLMVFVGGRLGDAPQRHLRSLHHRLRWACRSAGGDLCRRACLPHDRRGGREPVRRHERLPRDPTTDTGLYEGDVGRHWVNQGFIVGGSIDKIVGFADCDIRGLDEVRYSVLLTGNAMLGLMLPRIAEERLDLWDVPTNSDDAQIIGGHCVPVMGWDADHWFAVSWGQVVPMTLPLVRKYMLEAHVTLSPRWINGNGTTRAGVSWDGLVAATREFSARAAAAASTRMFG